MPNIKTLSGTVNLRKQSAKVCIFHAPAKKGKGHKEIFLDKAATNGVTGGTDGVIRRVGMPQYYPSIPGTVTEVGGQMVNQTFDIKDGEIIKVFVTVRRGWGKIPKMGSVFLRPRASAAYRKLRFEMIIHADVAVTQAEIEGNFDRLTVEEVLTAGVFIPKAFRDMGSQDNVDSILTEEIVMEEESEAAIVFTEKKITDGAGAEKLVTVRKRRRGIE